MIPHEQTKADFKRQANKRVKGITDKGKNAAAQRLIKAMEKPLIRVNPRKTAIHLSENPITNIHEIHCSQPTKTQKTNPTSSIIVPKHITRRQQKPRKPK